jgi:hypothetical protein
MEHLNTFLLEYVCSFLELLSPLVRKPFISFYRKLEPDLVINDKSYHFE